MISNIITAAVIAGGKAVRFGGPKIRAEFRGRKLIDYAVDLARDIAAQVFIVNGNDLDYSEFNISTVSDIVPECGPIGGLHTALHYASTPYAAVLPADMPLLTAEVYQHLLQYLDDKRPVIALSSKGEEPLVSIWPKTALPVFNKLIAAGDYSLRIPIKELNAVLVNLPDVMPGYSDDIFLNINYREDLDYGQP